MARWNSRVVRGGVAFCDPDDPDPNGQIALHCAIGLGDLGTFERLLSTSDVRAVENSSATPLMLSIKRGDLCTFHASLPASDAQAVDAKGKTALMLAADRGELEIAQVLPPASNAKAADHEGLTALMIATVNRRLKIAAALIFNFDADAVDQDGKTALMHAMDGWLQDKEVIVLLAERSDLPKISKMGCDLMEVAMNVNGLPKGAAKKLLGMMSAQSERDELLSVMEETKKSFSERKLDAFKVATKAKKKPRILKSQQGAKKAMSCMPSMRCSPLSRRSKTHWAGMSRRKAIPTILRWAKPIEGEKDYGPKRCPVLLSIKHWQKLTA